VEWLIGWHRGAGTPNSQAGTCASTLDLPRHPNSRRRRPLALPRSGAPRELEDGRVDARRRVAPDLKV